MKKLITLLILFSASCLVAQDVTVTLGRGSTSYRDTLTATIDSVKINAVQTNNVFTIYAYTLTGTDTINVYTTPKGYTLWSQKSLVDLSTNSVVTQIIATTTPKEYLLQDPEMVSMLLVTPDGSAGTVFIVSPKSTANPVNAATPNSLPLPTGAATAANQVIHNTKLDSIDATASRTEGKVATASNQTNGSQKTQVVDGSGNVIGATSNALDVNVKSGSVAVSSLAGNGTSLSGNITITTAAPLHSNTACKKVTITNYTAGEYVFVGGASVTTANGFPLGYLDSITLTVSNLNLVYVVSDGTSCDIRFSYEN